MMSTLSTLSTLTTSSTLFPQTPQGHPLRSGLVGGADKNVLLACFRRGGSGGGRRFLLAQIDRDRRVSPVRARTANHADFRDVLTDGIQNVNRILGGIFPVSMPMGSSTSLMSCVLMARAMYVGAAGSNGGLNFARTPDGMLALCGQSCP